MKPYFGLKLINKYASEKNPWKVSSFVKKYRDGYQMMLLDGDFSLFQIDAFYEDEKLLVAENYFPKIKDFKIILDTSLERILEAIELERLRGFFLNGEIVYGSDSSNLNKSYKAFLMELDL